MPLTAVRTMAWMAVGTVRVALLLAAALLAGPLFRARFSRAHVDGRVAVAIVAVHPALAVRAAIGLHARRGKAARLLFALRSRLQALERLGGRHEVRRKRGNRDTLA